MAKCAVLVPRKSGNKKRPCGCEARVLYRVEYAQFEGYHRRFSGKTQDVFPVCLGHRDQMSCPQAWSGRGYGAEKRVSGIRGTVVSVALEPFDQTNGGGLDAAYRGDAHRTLMDSFKSGIKRMMQQENARALSTDDWRVLCEEAVEEFVVASVMQS